MTLTQKILNKKWPFAFLQSTLCLRERERERERENGETVVGSAVDFITCVYE